ncbi:MAG: hypothetical protein U0835_08120 [Isosphaeraceae bacterium]
MARCDQGYLCEVCGKEVEEITDSDLYLRFVLGEVDPETLHVSPERHLRCNPTLSQFIADHRFPAVIAPEPFDRASLDPDFVAEEEARVTRGYRRLLEVVTQHLTIPEYVLPEARDRWLGQDPPSQGD